jgi:hypothetical protein
VESRAANARASAPNIVAAPPPQDPLAIPVTPENVQLIRQGLLAEQEQQRKSCDRLHMERIQQANVSNYWSHHGLPRTDPKERGRSLAAEFAQRESLIA